MIDDGQLEPIYNTENIPLPVVPQASTNPRSSIMPPPGFGAVSQSPPRVQPPRTLHGPNFATTSQQSADLSNSSLIHRDGEDRIPHDPFVSPSRGGFVKRPYDTVAANPEWYVRLAAQNANNYKEDDRLYNRTLQHDRQVKPRNIGVNPDYFGLNANAGQVDTATLESSHSRGNRGPERQQQRTVLHDPYLKPNERNNLAAGPRSHEVTLKIGSTHHVEHSQPGHQNRIDFGPELVEKSWNVGHSTRATSSEARIRSTSHENYYSQLRTLSEGTVQEKLATPYPSSQCDMAPRRAATEISYLRQHQDKDDRQKTGEETDCSYSEYYHSEDYPQFMDEFANPLNGHLCSSDSKLNRIWSTGVKDTRNQLQMGSNWAQKQESVKQGGADPQIASLFAGPLLSNLRFYFEEALKRREEESKPASHERSRYKQYDSNAYFARTYDPFGTKFGPNRSWLTEI